MKTPETKELGIPAQPLRSIMLPFADLHTHTTCSDGSFSPTQLLQEASVLKLKGLSITDHDTLNAYQEILPLAQSLNITLLSGVEFSSLCGKTSVHILAYGFSLKNPIIIALCEKHLIRRKERCLEMLTLLKAHNLSLHEDTILQEALKKNQLIGRPHIAAAMIRQGYAASMEEAFQHYLGEGCPCYRSATSLSTEEMVDAIHAAQGLAILAHPHLIQDASLLNKLLNMPFDGIEVYYACFPMQRNRRFLEIAQRKKWLATGGSDFHGSVKPHIALASSWTPQETFEQLLLHYTQNTQNG